MSLAVAGSTTGVSNSVTARSSSATGGKGSGRPVRICLPKLLIVVQTGDGQ
jgi:hypothetical protein